jgi:hypothetical protein
MAVSAVFVRRGDPTVHTWKLGRPLSTLPAAMGSDLGVARAATPYDFARAARILKQELFVPTDRQAMAALDSLTQLAAGASRATIYARIVTRSGDNLPLPLGLIDVGGKPLGSVATIATPLPHETTGDSRLPCINRRVIVSDSSTFDGIKPRPSGTALVGYASAKDYFGTVTPDRVALVLLGHHGSQEELVFDPLTPATPMTPGFLTRTFNHEVGFFMVCGLTAAASDLPTTWLEKFGDHGIDAAVASPFEIETGPAEKFLTAVQEVLADLPSSSSIAFADLYAAAIDQMAKKGDAKAYEALEYVVVGDGSVKICGEGQKQ